MSSTEKRFSCVVIATEIQGNFKITYWLFFFFSKLPLKIPIANNLLFKEPLRLNRKKLCSIKLIPTCRSYPPLLDDMKHDLVLISGPVSAWNILHVTCVAFFSSLDVGHLLILLSLIANTHTKLYNHIFHRNSCVVAESLGIQ